MAVLALVSQLALGAMLLPDDPPQRQQSALDAISVMCSSTAPMLPDHRVPHHRHVPDCAPLPLGVALALPAFMPMSPPALPGPLAARMQRRVSAASARGPPSHYSHIGFPRGPPTLA
jgi:hypothetical protein